AIISGLVAGGGAIDLAGVGYSNSGSVSLSNQDVLTVTENGQSYALNLDPSEDYSSSIFSLSPDGSGTDVRLLNIQLVSGQTVVVTSSAPASTDFVVESGGILQVGDFSGPSVLFGAISAATISQGGSLSV